MSPKKEAPRIPSWKHEFFGHFLYNPSKTLVSQKVKDKN